MLPKHLGNYEVLEKIGAGGMGEVYRARDARLGRDVALKLLPDAFANDPERLARFEREARLLASLNHASIGAIYGFEQHEGARFLILELVPGEDLSQRIARGALSLDEALPIARDIAEAVEFAHEQGVVHRDLKPANVKITPDGRVKVLDFGLAKALEGDDGRDPRLSQSPTILASSPTIAGVILGTAAYMSPEQARGKLVDKRSDVFAFACVLYEMLTGQLAFPGETVSDTLASVLKTQPDYALLPSGTPRAIRDLLKRCFEKDPKLRLRDIGEARIAIDHARHAPEEETAAVIAAPAAHRRRNLVWVGVAIAAAGAAFLAARATVPAPPEPPLRKFEIVLVDSLETGLESEGRLGLSPDGSRLAYVHANRLWVRDWAEPEPREVPGSEGADVVFWSPDGQNVAFFANQRIMRNRLDGGNSTTLCNITETMTGGRGAVWTADDRILFTGGTPRGMYEVSALGGDAVVWRSPGVDSVQDYHEPSLLPDGRSILVVSHDRDGPERISVITGGKIKHILRLPGLRIWDPVYSPTGHVLFRRTPTNPGVWALPFSLDRLEATGEPFMVAASAAHPQVAGNGMLITRRTRDLGMVQLFWVNRKGEFQTAASPASTAVGHPALSPDGKRLAMCFNDGVSFDVRVLDVERETLTRVTYGTAAEISPSWSADGAFIYFQDGGTQTIKRVHADGTGTPEDIRSGMSPDVTPDGKAVVFVRDFNETGNQADIVWASLEDSTRERVLVSGPARQNGPAVAPNGEYFAYSSDESGKGEVYLSRLPDGSGKWQVSVEGGIVPRWSRSGKRLYYLAGVDVMEVDVSFTPTLSLGKPRVLFQVDQGRFVAGQPARYAVEGEGERFLFSRLLPTTDRSLHTTFGVVENWFSEFKNQPKK